MAATTPRTLPLEAKYRRARILNVILGAACAFLLIVVIAQLGGGSSPALRSAAPAVSTSPGASAPASTTDASTPDTAPGTASGSTAPTSRSGADSPLVRRDPDDPMALGDIAAPVVMVMWTDMRCPFCGQFSRDTLPVITEEFVGTGKVRIEVRDVAFFGEKSAAASVAARAAAKQGKFNEYLQAVYAAAPESGKPDLPRNELIAFAGEAGVADIDQFTADLDDPKLLAAVQQSTAEAQQIGVSSVPFFVIGNEATAGAQPIEAFRTLLNNAIASS